MELSLKILHLEDNPSDAELIARELKKAKLKFTIQVAETKEQYIDALENYKPDVILSDHSLPRFNSMDALMLYKEYKYEVPFILITGAVSEEFAIRSIKEGADDYILKNNLIRLPSAIEQSLKSRKIELEKRSANSELEVINKELNTFIYKAAHDLRGPLCSIMGLINVANQKTEENNLAGYIQKISESTQKLDSVLLSLMDVMSVKNVTPVIKEINFEVMIHEIIERARFVESCDNLDTVLDINFTGSFFSDETILKTVLYNVVENAMKYRDTRKHTTFISIGLTQTEADVTIQIKDNGIGMEKDILVSIFDMYYRGNQYSKGSGLGLYVAKSGVKKLGGTIGVSSTVNIGSVFTLTLPQNVAVR